MFTLWSFTENICQLLGWAMSTSKGKAFSPLEHSKEHSNHEKKSELFASLFTLFYSLGLQP